VHPPPVPDDLLVVTVALLFEEDDALVVTVVDSPPSPPLPERATSCPPGISVRAPQAAPSAVPRMSMRG
jgi:hypothetical protein